MEKNYYIAKYKNYILLLGLVVITLFFIYRLWQVDISTIPLSYTNDSMFSLAIMKVIREDRGLGYVSNRLGGAYGFQLYDFNSASLLLNIIKKIITILVPNVILAHNIFFFSGFVFVAWTSYYVLTKIKIDTMVAIVVSMLYAFVPYHMQRGEAHINLAFYVLIPLVVYYARKFMLEAEMMSRKEHMIFGLIMLAVGMSGVYYAFFACFFFCVTVLYQLLQKKICKQGILGCIYIIIGGVLGGSPSIIYWIKYGKEYTVTRDINDLTMFALQLPRLLLPITDHRLKLFANIKNIYNTQHSKNETDIASLGFFMSVAFIILLLVLLKKKRGKIGDKLYEIAILNLSAVLYGVAGGFVLLQGMFFTTIRCTNRISIYIAFFCCIALGIVLTDGLQWMDNIPKLKKVRWKKEIVLGAILIIGILDQSQKKYVMDKYVNSLVQEDKTFIREIEQNEKEGIMIYQLPYEQFPEAGKIEKMTDYSQFVGYIYSDSLKWSYGSIVGSDGDKINKKIAQEREISDMLEDIIAEGYGGIFINRLGYDEEEYEQLQNTLTKLLGQEPMKSKKEKYLYYSLEDYIEKNADEVDNDSVKVRLYTGVEYESGCYDEETDGVEIWRWMEQNSVINLYNYFDRTVTVRFKFKTRSLDTDDVLLTFNDVEYTIPLNTDQVLEFEVQPGDNCLTLDTEAEYMKNSEDTRNLCYALLDYDFEFDLKE